MKSVFAAASVVAVLAVATPGFARGQEPRRAPTAAPPAEAPTQPAPREGAAPRDVAVPRAETQRAETERADTRRGSPPEPEARSHAQGSDEQERRGAVRRPPSDGGGRSGGQAPRDRAVARTSPPPRDWDGDGDRGRERNRVYYYPSYYSYGRYYDPYYSGFHLGYLAYSPWGWTPAFYGYPYGYGTGVGYQSFGLGSLRLKVKPRDAEVYVDGYFAGNVDDFDGVFQSLKLETGGYRVEIRKPGHETLTFDVQLQPERTITYRGEMRPTP